MPKMQAEPGQMKTATGQGKCTDRESKTQAQREALELVMKPHYQADTPPAQGQGHDHTRGAGFSDARCWHKDLHHKLSDSANSLLDGHSSHPVKPGKRKCVPISTHMSCQPYIRRMQGVSIISLYL